MFIRFLFAFFIFFLPSQFYAQSRSTSFGAHFISNYSSFKKFDGDLSNVFKYVFGHGVGGSFEYGVGKRFYLGAEINYERKGSGYKINFTDENGNPLGIKEGLAVHLDYLSLPLMMKYKFKGKFNFNVQAGIAFHYLVNIKSKFSLEYVSGGSALLFNELKDYYRLDQSVIGGVGIERPLNEQLGIYFNARFNYGLIETYMSDRFPWTNKNLVYSVLAGVFF